MRFVLVFSMTEGSEKLEDLKRALPGAKIGILQLNSSTMWIQRMKMILE